VSARVAEAAKGKMTMGARVAVLQFAALGLFGGATTVGCWDDNPCDPGQVVRQDQCVAAPASTAAASDAGDASPATDASGSGGDGSVVDTFGKACTTASDCAGGNAPVCGAPQLPLCTQIDCQAGEAHAGVCPSGWQCLATAGNPSVCLN
jgi:hypothetical protein